MASFFPQPIIKHVLFVHLYMRTFVDKKQGNMRDEVPTCSYLAATAQTCLFGSVRGIVFHSHNCGATANKASACLVQAAFNIFYWSLSDQS